MYAHFKLAALVTMAFAIPVNPASRFTVDTSGAISVNANGADARYGVIPAEVNGRTMLTISLGATNSRGSVLLSIVGDRLPVKGRYPIQNSAFHAVFVAGSPEHPLGWFHGESGWVTITNAVAGHLSGEFEIQSRGFLRSNLNDDNQWVTVRGTFQARGDSTSTTIASMK